MKQRSAYWEKLRDPRWQKMRLRVMERDSFRCQSCGADDKTLNVHHLYYRRNADPWDYPMEALRTLCEPCHGASHELQERCRTVLGCLSDSYLFCALGYLEVLRLDADYATDEHRIYPENYEHAEGMANYLGHADAHVVIGALESSEEKNRSFVTLGKLRELKKKRWEEGQR